MFNYYKTPTIFVQAQFLVDFCFPPAKVNKPKHGILATLAANMTSKFHMGSQNTASARISRNQRRVLGIICSAANLWYLFSLGVPGLFFVSSWWCWTKPSEKYVNVKMASSSPNFQGENSKKCFWNHHHLGVVWQQIFGEDSIWRVESQSIKVEFHERIRMTVS